MSGWIKIHRKVTSHPFYQENRTFSKFEAWIDLLLRANYQDEKVALGNDLIDVQRGSFITSELKLMERWKWSKSKVRAFLELLQNEKMIVKKTDRKKTTITIVNYGVYQDKETTEEPQKNRKKTASRPQKDTDKERKELKELKHMPEFEVFWSAYPRKTGKQRAYAKWLDRVREVSAETLIQAAENYAKQCKALKTEQWFIKHPSTFLSDKLDYEDYVNPGNVLEFRKPAPVYETEDWEFQMPKTEKLRMFD